MSHDPGIDRPANRLAREKSPYLLQHAHNPVDWYPWGDEAFAKARTDDKPIFLSIGYSTCHWCHVMERESFENEEVARLLNDGFVPVKVDREERPDVDRIYMTAMQALGMGGGWPLNVFLTPALRPFFGGTYFPPRALSGRIGMIELLPRVREAWAAQREQVERTGDEVIRALASLDERSDRTPNYRDLIAGAFAALERLHDHEHGGFGNAPKFPSTVNLNFLQRVAARAPERREPALAMITRQLDAMAAGGIHDHLGGGFHRYSTDAHWLVPHFEKMLYDQALLAWAYLEGFQVTENPRHAEVARGIFDYVARDLSSPNGGFLSAEDADSEGEEGRFYVWTPADLERLLGPEDAGLFADRYGVSAHGNFEHAATVLSEVQTIDAVAERHGRAAPDVSDRLQAARATLLAHRGARVRPHRDDKVLTAWNGLMISAFARGARVLGDAALAARAQRAGTFVWEHLRDSEGRLLRRWRDGEAAGAAQLDDHAYLALGFVDLLQVTGDPVWLERASGLTEAMLGRFWDERDGACFESPGDDPSIAVRMKDGFDGAEMAGNSIAAYNLRLLGTLMGRPEWVEKARRACDYYAARLAGQPVAMPQMLVAMDLMESTPRHVVVAGRPEAGDTRALVQVFERRFLPHDVLLPADGGEGQRRLAALAPFVAPLVPREGRATAYVCVEGACRLPVTEPEAFAEQLEAGV